jgi:SAM-dependent methyltransferase
MAEEPAPVQDPWAPWVLRECRHADPEREKAARRGRQAFREFYRVLKSNGRLYIEEPIDRFGGPEPDHLLWGYDVTPIQDSAQKVRSVFERLQPRDTDPMLDFDERDLVRFAEAAGFTKIDLEFQAHIDCKSVPSTRRDWDRAWRSADNPRVPTLEEAVKQALTSEEAEAFVAYLRPKVEAEPRMARWARAYLWSVK